MSLNSFNRCYFNKCFGVKMQKVGMNILKIGVRLVQSFLFKLLCLDEKCTPNKSTSIKFE